MLLFISGLENSQIAVQKPVSSLRSHFENIASQIPTPNSPSFPSLLHPEVHGQSEAARSRLSLDLPRSNTPQNSAGKTATSNKLHSSHDIPSTPRRVATGRSSSAGSERLAPPRKSVESYNPPLVTIQSPTTPRKQSTMHQGSPAKNSVPHKLQVQNAGPVVSPMTSNISQIEPWRSRGDSYEATVGKATNVPPPVNRADKPKFGTRGVGNGRKPTLHANDAAVNDGASPFSTPPSSDESPSQLEQHGIKKPHAQHTPGRPLGARDSYFSPPRRRADCGPYKMRNTMESDGSMPGLNRRSHAVETVRSDEPSTRPRLPLRNQDETKVSQPTNERFVDKHVRLSATPLNHDPPRSVPISGFGMRGPPNPTSDFLPPPKRMSTLGKPEPATFIRPDRPYDTRPSTEAARAGDTINVLSTTISSSKDYPDASNVNRRPPTTKDGVRKIEIGYDTRLFDIWRDTVCTSGYVTRAWDVGTGEMITNLQQGEGSTRVTAMAFKPANSVDEEGQIIWLGNNYGEIQEVDLSRRGAIVTQSRAHGGKEIIKIYRHQNNLWTLDEDGKMYVWPPGKSGTPDLQSSPIPHRLSKGHTYSMIVQNRLWIACGRDVRVFEPGRTSDNCCLTPKPLCQAGIGEVTSGATIYGQFDRVYFGHADGKVTIYSTSSFDHLGTVTISVYKINTLAGVGNYLWAGFNTGMIYAYDTQIQPWLVKKDWLAHKDPVANIIVDRSSLWMTGTLQVASIGTDNAIRMWEGTLEDDFLGMS